jgi:hypothetical protein
MGDSMEKKHKAKMEMLKMLSKMMSDEGHEGLGEGLKGKKLQKVTVAAPDTASLKKGLSKAQQILAAKLGSSEDSEESESEEECEDCAGEGCESCESEE